MFRAHPVRMVYGGPVFWDAAQARTVMRAYRDFLPDAPEEFGTFVGLKTVPPVDPFPREHWGKRVCAIVSCYNDSEDAGASVMAPLLDAAGPALFNWMTTMPFTAIQSLFDPLLPRGLQWYWKGDFVRSLSDEAIDVHITEADKAPSVLSLMHLYPIDGAVRRVAGDATAWNARDATWAMVIAAIDADPKSAEALKTWGRAYWTRVHQFNPGGAYVNFMMDDEAADRLEATYGDNFARLARTKAVYDPANLFRVNQNIRPSTVDQ